MDIRLLTEEDKREIDKHKDSMIHRGEVHGMKFVNGKLQVYNGQEWIELKGGGLPVSITRNVTVKENSRQVNLMWEDPEDVKVNGQTVAKWKSTKIVRKQGSMPKNDEDGVLVGQSSIRNQYKNRPFIDTQGLVNDREYYYGVFPESEDEIVTVSEKSIVKATPKEQLIYGFEIDEGNSNPETAVKYIGDSVGFTPMKVSNYGSWEKFVKNISTPVLLKSGRVQYELQYNNYTKKKDGSSSTLTGTDGDVMIRFKHLWVKEEKASSTKRRVWLSDGSFDGATSYTKITEKGYNQLSWGILMTLQHLYLLLYKDRDSQTALGRGYVDGNSDFTNTGGANTKPYFFGETTGKQQMKFCGIESFWDNKYNWVDGVVSDGNYDLKIGYTNFNDLGLEYKLIKTPITSNTFGYFRSTMGGEAGYIQTDRAGSSSTGYCDYGSVFANSAAHFGGVHNYDDNAGAFNIRVNESSASSSFYCGARLCFVDDNYFYVGAYTGYVEGSKLRSISGKTPTDNKQIGEFRIYAQNNN